VALVLLLGVSFAECLAGLAERWANEPDYSHGFFVPVFAAFLLWWRRAMRVPIPTGGRWVGTGLVVASALIRLASVRLNYTLLEPMSLLPCLAGVALLIGGWGWLRWSWPAIAFLAFMIPLPGFVAGQLGGPLQRITTVASTYLLQTFDVPATATGNVIWLTEGRIGVVEACNGLRMLIAFFAVTIGAALVMRGSLREKAVIVLSAPAIGLFANIVRITATGLAHEWISPDVADRLFHDFAGWLMMPLAAGCLLMELYLLSRLLIAPIEGPVVRIKNDAARTAMKGA
jgi:exosortase